ncbi:hypothetical protein SAMN05445060_1879 [Williamsia sterculiae]|uniref:Uncharacterized protein n=1 Tax=Williamsia sterculiae TaxID=1344003 RepID=A0A1N7F6Y2_9NOCA|nr:hypothetical protein SAMN05445060_1879 [Williamsia sterculiae]
MSSAVRANLTTAAGFAQTCGGDIESVADSMSENTGYSAPGVIRVGASEGSSADGWENRSLMRRSFRR